MKIKLLLFGIITLLILYACFILVSLGFIGNLLDISSNTEVLFYFLFPLLFDVIFFIAIYILMINPLEKINKFTNNTLENRPVNSLKNYALLSDLTKNIEEIRAELLKSRINEINAQKNNKKIITSLNHNVKTPVQSIREIAELLQMRIEPGKERSQLEAISAKAEYVGNLITEILSTSESDDDEIEISLTEISSIDIYEMIGEADYDKNCVYIGAIPKCNVITDKIRFQQALDNVISNSYKYAGTRITVHSRITESFLEITLKDYGNGVNPEEISKVFEKYYRGQNVGNRSGCGLGLFYSAYYLEHMGGAITCENFTGGFGVTVSLKLADKKPAEQLIM